MKKKFPLTFINVWFEGSQHSGTGEEDFVTSSNDLDNIKAESGGQPDPESDDEDGIDCKCVVCDRQCQDIDQWVCTMA